MNMKRKKITALAMAIILTAAAMTGCGAKEETPAIPSEPVQEVMTEPVTESETTQATESAPKMLNLEAVILREEGSIPGTMEANYRLPSLDADTPLAEAFDNWVESVFESWKHNIDWYAEDDHCNLDYKAAVCHNILSVEFFINDKQFPFLADSGIFSIDLETDEKLTTEGILKRADSSREMLEEFIRQELQRYFEFEDSLYGTIQDAPRFREEMLSSENLKNTDAFLSVRMYGTFQLAVPAVYYVDTQEAVPTAKAHPAPTVNFVYLDGLSKLSGKPLMEDASEWIAAGETGTVEGEHPASYQMPKLISDKIDAAAFTEWADTCLNEWKTHLGSWVERPDAGTQLNYRAFVMGDILSVILTDGTDEIFTIWMDNPSISFSLTTGKKLALDDILDRAGYPKEQLKTDALEVLERYWKMEDEEYGAIAEIEECRAAVFTQENMDKWEFQLWPGDVGGYSEGTVTLNITVPYTIRSINGVPTAEQGEHTYVSVLLPGLSLR